MQKGIFILAIASLVIVSCKNNADKKEVYQAINPSSLDSTFKPGDDFYAFVNAKWIAANPIPADKSR
ncbi:MAG: hypothetical protein ACK4IY_08635, partial [Chitinophagales bacterium]